MCKDEVQGFHKKPFSKKKNEKGKMANNLALEEYQYCGSPVAVPFIWESEPGTPKFSHFNNKPLPPLTPPPSYFSNSKKSPTNIIHPSKNTNRLTNIFLNPRKPRKSPSSSSFSSSNSQSSVPSSPVAMQSRVTRRSFGASRRKSFDLSARMADEEQHECDSRVSDLCFGFGQGRNGRSPGCYSSIIKLLIA